MTDDVKEQLMERLSLYSYDYVIPDLNDGELDPDTVDVQQFVGKAGRRLLFIKL